MSDVAGELLRYQHISLGEEFRFRLDEEYQNERRGDEG